MTRRFTRLAWIAATGTYLLIVLGAVVRITGSGLGCGEHWPLCNGRLLPPLDLPTLIEYAHRLVAALAALLLGFVTVLFGALTANLGAASARLGFPLCNGQLAPAGNALQQIHWTHRLLAYTLAVYTVWWAVRTRPRGAWAVVAVVLLQLGVGAAMVLFALPRPLQAAHVAAGAGVWAVLDWVVLGWPPVVSAPRF